MKPPTDEVRAATYVGASAAIAALTMFIDGASADAMQPLRGLNLLEDIAARAELVCVAGNALTELAALHGTDPTLILQRLGLGIARDFG